MLPAIDQMAILSRWMRERPEVTNFEDRIPDKSLTAVGLTTLQINVGKQCNQVCKHCHVDAGPTRKENMTRPTFDAVLSMLDQCRFQIVDITGGAPEMNPHFRWFVEQVRLRGAKVIVRCNLTIIEAHEKFADLPDFFAKHQVEVVSSLPSFDQKATDRQRGDGVFEKSIRALTKLNRVGYGTDPNCVLNLVYNPNGAYLPGDQSDLEAEFKRRLLDEYGIVFNNLFTITNMPISRFLEYLIDSRNLTPYMEKLIRNYNPQAVNSVMCRSILSVSWDGKIYDCDFNQMLDLPVQSRSTVFDYDPDKLRERKIVLGPHCFGCTAGAGSSCGGAVV